MRNNEQGPRESSTENPSEKSSTSRRTLLLAGGAVLVSRPFSTAPVAGSHHPTGVLFHADFESLSTGVYEPRDEDWGGYDVDYDVGSEDEHQRSQITERAGNRFLDVLFPAGNYGNDDTGADFQVRFGEHFEELSLAYHVRFGEGFEFDKKGGKLPGLIGSNDGINAVSGGDDPDGTNGWSARMMWRNPQDESDGGRAQFYTYHPDQPGEYGEEMDWDQAPGGQQYFQRGTWHWVEHRITMNTPGANDGVMEGWFDGEKAFERTDLRFWDIDGKGINRLYVSTFFGGSNDAWAHDRDEHIHFDDFIISTKRILVPPAATLSLRRQSGYETGNLGIMHTGGEFLDTATLTVYADGKVADDGNGWDVSKLEPGDDVWYYAPDTGTDYFVAGQEVAVVHDPSDTTLVSTTLDDTPEATLALYRQRGYETGNLGVEHVGGATLDTATLTVYAGGEVADDGRGWEVSDIAAGDAVWFYAPDTGTEYFVAGQTVEIVHEPTAGVIATATLEES